MFGTVAWCVDLVTKHTKTFCSLVLHLLVRVLSRWFIVVCGKGNGFRGGILCGWGREEGRVV